jgi:hypothetical protein
MPTVAWVLFTGLAFWMLKNMPKRRRGGGGVGGGRGGGGRGAGQVLTRIRSTLDAVMVRCAAVLFLVAGMISAGGVVGAALSWFVGVTGSVGSGVIWVAWMLLALTWLAGIVSEKLFPGDVPDWLSLSGLALPSLLASVPGPVGHSVMAGLVNLHDAIGPWVGSGFGVAA